MKEYYDTRAPEYDDWWLQRGLYSDRDNPDWAPERDAVFGVIEALPPSKTLDVACGTGFVTRHLPGEVVGLDQSPRMVEIAREQAPDATFVVSDALTLPFEDGAFDRIFTSHFYGHLEPDDRERFLAETRRVATELVVFDAGRHHGEPRDEWQDRVLKDGTHWPVFKRFFDAKRLLHELGGGTVLHEGTWFVLVRA